MRVSDYFRLNRSQPTLDFVDVDIHGDLRVFVDPRALRLLPSTWATRCVSLIQDFFHHVLRQIQSGRNHDAEQLLRSLREPNETHLGLSRHRARGHALGQDSAYNVWHSLQYSQAVRSGLLEDLEDTILMVEGIAADIVSDITTNIIREPLIEYTQSICQKYLIPLTPDIDSGPLWDAQSHSWDSRYVPLPVAEEKKLLLVPKAIIRRRMDYDVGEYYRDYLLSALQDAELSANSELVQLLKNGTRRVTKKSIREKYGYGKRMIVQQTRNHPEVLDRYREDKRRSIQPPMEHEEVAVEEQESPPDWNQLIQTVQGIAPGPAAANNFQRAVEDMLTALFYPELVYPVSEQPIHRGRKRIDITFTNMATTGFFKWLAQHYQAAHVFVECKNYNADPANPELDQLAGRFSETRGQFGLLVCRKLIDRELFMERCRDTARDHRGFIIPLDDDDLHTLVAERQTKGANRREPAPGLLRDRFNDLVM